MEMASPGNQHCANSIGCLQTFTENSLLYSVFLYQHLYGRIYFIFHRVGLFVYFVYDFNNNNCF